MSPEEGGLRNPLHPIVILLSSSFSLLIILSLLLPPPLLLFFRFIIQHISFHEPFNYDVNSAWDAMRLNNCIIVITQR